MGSDCGSIWILISKVVFILKHIHLILSPLILIICLIIVLTLTFISLELPQWLADPHLLHSFAILPAFIQYVTSKELLPVIQLVIVAIEPFKQLCVCH